MPKFLIESKASTPGGLYDGDTPQAAFAAMLADAGASDAYRDDGTHTVGTIDDWIIVRASTDGGFVIEAGADLGALAERMGPDATKGDAEAFLDLLRDAGYSGWTTDCVPEGRWLALLTAAVDARATAAEDADWWLGRRVEAGDDHDTGTVDEVLSASSVRVAWDSGVRTPADVSALR